MRLGGPILDLSPAAAAAGDPADWVAAAKALGYRAVYCPLDQTAPDDVVRAYEQAATAADLVMAEVGAWSNPISPDDAERTAALRLCQERLALADRIGARCCVNISGSRSTLWDGPDADNLTPATFDLIVETTRAIIDAVRPVRAAYCLETMPWAYPDSVESYERLLDAIGRPAFAVHLDPVNLVSSPQRYYGNAALIRECFARLGPRVRSCHAKDIALATRLTTHLDEVRAGLGGLDYATFLRELDKLPADTPLMLEHLPAAADYDAAAAHIRGVAAEIGVGL